MRDERLSVTFDERPGYVASAPELRTPVTRSPWADCAAASRCCCCPTMSTWCSRRLQTAQQKIDALFGADYARASRGGCRGHAKRRQRLGGGTLGRCDRARGRQYPRGDLKKEETDRGQTDSPLPSRKLGLAGPDFCLSCINTMEFTGMSDHRWRALRREHFRRMCSVHI
jgi:hypothetical protein